MYHVKIFLDLSWNSSTQATKRQNDSKKAKKKETKSLKNLSMRRTPTRDFKIE